MQEPGPLPINQLINKLIDQSSYRQKLLEASVVDIWHRIMPAAVSRRTNHIYVKQDKIFVKVSSDALRHILYHTKQEILEKLQANLGQYKLADIVFIT